MGTRGIMGVRVGGVDKFQYNQFDTYPSGLGKAVVADLRKLMRDPGPAGLLKMATDLRVVDGKSTPTEDDVAKLRSFTDLGVSRQSTDDWYCLLRHTQGQLRDTLFAGTVVDSADFMADSLFCEWAYVVNVDDGVLEVYRGFQHDAHSLGRYADMPRTRDDYFPCALAATFPLDSVSEEDMDALERRVDEEDE